MTANPPLDPLELALRPLWQGDEALEQGDQDTALMLFQQSLAGFRALATAEEPRDGLWELQLAECQLRIGRVHLRQGRIGPAHACFAESRTVCLQLLAAGTTGQGARDGAVRLLGSLGDVILMEGGAMDEALDSYQLSLGIWRRLALTESADEYEGEVATGLIRVASILELRGDLPGALEIFREALSIRQRQAQTDRHVIAWQLAVASAHARVAAVLAAQEDLDAALASYHSAVAICRGLLATEPANTDCQYALGACEKGIGEILLAAGRPEEALDYRQECVTGWRKMLAAGQRDSALRCCLAVTLQDIADMRQGMGDIPGALKLHQESRLLWQQLVGEMPDQLEWQEKLAARHEHIGDLQEELKDLAGALKSWRQAVIIQAQLVAQDPTRTDWRCNLGVTGEKLQDLQSRLMGPPEPEDDPAPGSLH